MHQQFLTHMAVDFKDHFNRSSTSLNRRNLTRHRTSAAMSPAGAAVLRDVLVTSWTGIVDAINAPPVPGLWQLSEVHKFMRTRCSSERKDFRSESFYEHDEIFKGSRFIATPSCTEIHIMHLGDNEAAAEVQPYSLSKLETEAFDHRDVGAL